MIAPEQLQIALEALDWAEADYLSTIKDKDNNAELTNDCRRHVAVVKEIKHKLEDFLFEEFMALEDMETV
jgi:hypothetical protein